MVGRMSDIMFEGLTPEEVVAEAADRINILSSKGGDPTDEEIMDLVRPIFHLYDLKDYVSAMMVWACLQKNSDLLFACHAYISEVMIICASRGHLPHKDFDWSPEGLRALKDAYVEKNRQRPPVVEFDINEN